MVTTSNNTSWNVISDVEKLLETEFEGGAVVYRSKIYENQNKRAIRLVELTGEQLSRIAGLSTGRRLVEVNLEYPVSSNERINDEKADQLFERIKRVLVNNCAYTPSGTYHWHDGLVEGLDHDPTRLADEEGFSMPPENLVDIKQLIWGVTVSEGIPA